MKSNFERNKHLISILISVFVNGVFILIFMFVVAWKEPSPPIPEYGIELNFEELDIQEASEGLVESQNNSEASVEAETEINVETETNSKTDMEADQNHFDNSVIDDENIQNIVTQPIENPASNTQNESKSSQEKQLKDNSTIDTEPSTEKKSKTEKFDINQNQKKNTLNDLAIYKNNSSQNKSGLDMTGWIWDFEPNPKDNSQENGRLVFEIKIDNRGELLSIKTLERSISPDLEKIYRAEVENLTFSKTSAYSMIAPISVGKITFIISSK